MEPLLRTVFTRAIQPTLGMIQDFVNTGDFNDPFNEFWVEKSPTLLLTSDTNRIPVFLSNSAAEIYKTGVAMN